MSHREHANRSLHENITGVDVVQRRRSQTQQINADDTRQRGRLDTVASAARDTGVKKCNCFANLSHPLVTCVASLQILRAYARHARPVDTFSEKHVSQRESLSQAESTQADIHRQLLDEYYRKVIRPRTPLCISLNLV